MKIAQTKTARSLRVKLNTTNPAKDQWGQIIDNSTGKVLHTGQLKHIKYVARKRYNLALT